MAEAPSTTDRPPHHELLQALWRLQELDRLRQEAAEALETSEEHEAWRRAVELHEQALQNADRLEEKLNEAQRSARRHEQAMRGHEDEAAMLEERLYSGSITSAKEMAQLQRRVESLRERAAAAEEAALEALETAESTGRSLNSLRERLQELILERDDKSAALHRRIEALRAEKNALDQERAFLASSIPAEWLTRYERLSAQTGGRPLARLQQERCGACRVALPSALAAQAKRRLTHCESCGRILIP